MLDANYTIGIIGGSGIYEIDGLNNPEWKKVKSTFGDPSDALLLGSFNEERVAFLPRHGRNHKVSPDTVNYQANIDVLKRIGCREIISLSACGSLREDLYPGTIVIPDQFIDRTKKRDMTFFGKGLVAHVAFGKPVCNRLCGKLFEAGNELDLPVHNGGTYLAMEGPQFSTRAEADLYRKWGCSVIGMTNMPEAKLAREAEICYASVAMVTDFDCWHPNHDQVTVDSVIKTLSKNADNGRKLVRAVIPKLINRKNLCDHGCERALDAAIITGKNNRDQSMVKKLDAIAGRVLNT